MLLKKCLAELYDMTTKHFLTNGIDLYDHHGFNVDNPDDRLHGKIVGLLFCGDFSDSQLQSFVHHLRPFFNRWVVDVGEVCRTYICISFHSPSQQHLGHAG